MWNGFDRSSETKLSVAPPPAEPPTAPSTWRGGAGGLGERAQRKVTSRRTFRRRCADDSPARQHVSRIRPTAPTFAGGGMGDFGRGAKPRPVGEGSFPTIPAGKADVS